MSSLSAELVKIAEQGEAAVLVTVVEVTGDGQIQPGAKCLIRDGKAQVETIGDAKVVAALVRERKSRSWFRWRSRIARSSSKYSSK
jgi:xanthine/CO dehydrogenase XdhC/CoxF family maturation factor